MKVSDIPDRWKLRAYEYIFHMEFELATIMRSGDKIIFRVVTFPNNFEESIWNINVFSKKVTAAAEKMFGCETNIFDDEGGAEISFPVDWSADEKLRDAYYNAIVMFEKVYAATISELKAEVNNL